MRDIKLYDTTLRDGSQGEGISYSVMDKVIIAGELDKLGVHFIEAGWPGSNPKDMEFYRRMSRKRLKQAKLVAFGSTRRPHSKAKDDANLKAFLKCGAGGVLPSSIFRLSFGPSEVALPDPEPGPLVYMPGRPGSPYGVVPPFPVVSFRAIPGKPRMPA